MAENIVKSVFFCFCLFFFFFCSLVSSKQVQIVKEVQNHKKSTTNGLHGETLITVSNKNVSFPNGKFCIQNYKTVFNYFYTK